MRLASSGPPAGAMRRSRAGGLALLLSCVVLVGRNAAAQSATDSVVYLLVPASRLVVKTGRAGLLGFAGHSHLIRARAVTGELVYYPGRPTSHLRLQLPTDSLEVLTPPDTAEIRKVTEAMRTDVLHVDRFPEMRFAAESIEARNRKLELPLAVTMEGTTRTLPVTAQVRIGRDTLRAAGTFTAKQSEFGIKPFSGGPGGTVKVADRVTFCFDLVAVRGATGARDQPASGPSVSATDVPGCVDSSKGTAAPAPRPM